MKIAPKSSESPKKRSINKSASSSIKSSNSICASSRKKIKLTSKITPDTTLSKKKTKTRATTPRKQAKRKKEEDNNETKNKVIKLDQDDGIEEIEEFEDKKLQRTLFESSESSDSEDGSSVTSSKTSPKDWKDLDYTTLSDFVEVNRTQSKKALSQKGIAKLVNMPLEEAVRKCMDGCRNVVWLFIFNKLARSNNVEEEPDLMQKPKLGKDMFIELAMMHLSPAKKGSDDEEKEYDDDESEDEQCLNKETYQVVKSEKFDESESESDEKSEDDDSKDVEAITTKKESKSVVKVKNIYALKSKTVHGPPIDPTGGKIDWGSLVKKNPKFAISVNTGRSNMCPVYVSELFKVKVNGRIRYACFLSFEHKGCWFNMPQACGPWLKQAWVSRHGGDVEEDDIPSIYKTLKDYKLRREHDIENNPVSRGDSQRYPQTRWGAISVVKKNNQKSVQKQCDELFSILGDFYSPRKEASPGEVLVSYCEVNQITRVLVGMKKYMGATREALVNGANKELIPYGKMKFSCLFGQTLDAFLLDYDIKEFLKNYADVWSWDQCDEDVKKKCYRDYPTRDLPIWDESAFMNLM